MTPRIVLRAVYGERVLTITNAGRDVHRLHIDGVWAVTIGGPDSIEAVKRQAAMLLCLPSRVELKWSAPR